MPGHDISSNRNPLKLEEYQLEYHTTIPSEENITKYPTFGGWCNTCKKTLYKQVPSECVEPCKKRSKETKTCMKKYLDNEHYENMDLEYQLKDGWYDMKHQQFNKPYECCRISSLNGTNEQQYYECCRFRANLCELPTSYIRNTNNCQGNQTLSGLKMSDDDKEYVECLENRVKSYEKTIKFVEYTESASVLQEDYEKINKSHYDRLQKSCEKLEGNQSHFNSIGRNDCSNEFKQEKNNVGLSYSLEMRSDPRSIFNDHNGDLRNVNETDKYCQTEPCFCTDHSRSNHFYNCSIHYETRTFFDKPSQDSTKPNITSLYTHEMKNLKEQLKELRNSTYNNSTSAEMVAESLVAKDEMEEKANNGISRDSPKIVRRTRTKLIRVKTRGRMANTIKVRRSATKSTLSSKASSVEIENSHSDYSDSDESLKEVDENSQVSDISPTESTTNAASNEPLSFSEITGSGDSTIWPLRESLFPNVPPYISFNAFNAEVPRKMPIGKKYFKWKLSTITPIVVRKVLSNSGFFLVRKSNQWLGTWGKHIKSPMFKTLKNYQKLNHFPGTFQLGRKDRLWRNFQRMINIYGLKEFGFLPHTYILPQELKLLKYNWENKNTGGEWFIIKPPASARGVGIKVINKWAQLPKKTSLVVQKYIENPYLINGSKFDLRLYVLVTSINPLRVYLYKEGLVRFASVKYSHNPKDIKEKYIHLTNYSINKLSSNYTANDDAHSTQGHKWTITKLLEYLNNDGVDTKVLWKNLEMLVIKTMIACEEPIAELCAENMNTRYNCYELFGIDVLLDETLKPWLLEVNISPSLHSSSPLDEHVKGPLVQTLFNMVQFHFPSKLASFVKPNLKCYEPKMYSNNLTQRETNKHSKFTNMQRRGDYLESILEHLTGDDVRHLIQAEDEFAVKDGFFRIFPTASSHKLLDFMSPRYYNRLFDAWETKYENNRIAGIERLQSLCSRRVHLKGAALSGIQKNGQTTNPGVKTGATKELLPPKDSFSINEMFSDETGLHEDLPLVPSKK